MRRVEEQSSHRWEALLKKGDSQSALTGHASRTVQ